MGLREIALRARVALTNPTRHARLQDHCRRGAAPMYVPFYHRVADQFPNDWTISRTDFRRHVLHCLEHCEPITLGELQSRVDSNQSYRPTITFTFDDGYAENCDFALPLLI
ncbi:MAG: polysaccharide deacetylase family protein, partial [Pirellulaceae bacterium]|nr:polysaccharide deacetylase family protein [Pirellulaceae bacterium]